MSVSRGAEYARLVAELAALEKITGSPAAKQISAFRDVYKQLLRWPLEGFWVRWAHTEFRFEGYDAALGVFNDALARPILSRSLLIWTEYLKFKLRLGNLEPTKCESDFKRAAGAIGSHFLAHDFFNLWLEISANPIDLLVHIIDNHTLHQYACFYARLIGELHPSNFPEFQRILGLDSTAITSSDEEARVREVIASKLELKYELHLRRASQVYTLVAPIRRPFFHPKECSEGQLWIKYAAESDNPESVYWAAIIPCFYDPQVWLSFIRFTWRSRGDLRAVYAMAPDLVPVLLHFALWLELQKDFENAKAVYLKTGGKGRIQQAQFLSRIGESRPTEGAVDDEVYTEADLPQL